MAGAERDLRHARRRPRETAGAGPGDGPPARGLRRFSSATSSSATRTASRSCTASRSTSARASTWRWSDAPARARPALSTSSPDSTAPWRGTVRVAGRDPARAGGSRTPNSAGRRAAGGAALLGDRPRQPDARRSARCPKTAVREAARIAGADAFIRALPQGLPDPAQRRQWRPRYRSSPRGSSSSSRWLARWSHGRPCSCSTRRPRRSTARATPRSARRSARPSCRAAARVLTVAHRLRPRSRPTGSSSSTRAASWRKDRRRRSRAAAGRFAALLELEAAGLGLALRSLTSRREHVPVAQVAARRSRPSRTPPSCVGDAVGRQRGAPVVLVEPRVVLAEDRALHRPVGRAERLEAVLLLHVLGDLEPAERLDLPLR